MRAKTTLINITRTELTLTQDEIVAILFTHFNLNPAATTIDFFNDNSGMGLCCTITQEITEQEVVQ